VTPEALKTRARELKFDLCGIARADVYPRLARLREWIASGCAGDMRYLSASLHERLDPAAVLPTVRSVISLAVVYNTSLPYSTSPDVSSQSAVSRYACGDDYHDVLRERLRMLVAWMAETSAEPFEAFSCVDNGPVQERVFAEQAGLGWIGKNTCLIHPTLGSWLFLAEVFTSLALPPDLPMHEQCGTCTRCLDACPTGAISQPYWVDATRCLSYLTIESRGSVGEELREAIGRHVYGCDVCQDVCPWNRRAAVSDDAAWQPREGLAFPALIDLCRLTDDGWRERLRGSAMRRAGLRRIRRSLAYAAGSLEEETRAEALDALAAHPSADAEFVAEAIARGRSIASD